MWVARCRLLNGEIYEKDLSPRFKDIYACQEYIDKHLQVLEYLLTQTLKFIDVYVDNKFTIRFGNHIRCYNLSQKRFCEGFDF